MPLLARIISTLSLREASHFHFSALYSSWRGSGIFLLVRHRHGVPYLAPGFFAPWRNELDVGHSVLGIRRDHYGSHARGNCPSDCLSRDPLAYPRRESRQGYRMDVCLGLGAVTIDFFGSTTRSLCWRIGIAISIYLLDYGAIHMLA